jgi:anti-anti-sigma regulatory factor
VIYRPTGALIFSNAQAFSDQARELLWQRASPPARVLIIDCQEMSDLDVTGSREVLSLFAELGEADVQLWLARLHGTAAEVAERTGVAAALGEDRMFGSTDEADSSVPERFKGTQTPNVGPGRAPGRMPSRRPLRSPRASWTMAGPKLNQPRGHHRCPSRCHSANPPRPSTSHCISTGP